MIDLNDFPAKAHALLALAHTYTIARMDYDGEARTIARILEKLGYMRWEGYNLITNEARYSLTVEGRTWLESQHASPDEHDEPNALDALCYDTTPAPEDDPRNWTGVR